MSPQASESAAVERFVGNPFSTRHTAPGRIEPLDREGEPLDLGKLLDRIAREGGRAAILGRHGRGKTTLLHRLAETAERRGDRVVRIRVRSPWDLIPILNSLAGSPSGSLICIDSWEQLGGPGAAIALLFARLRRCRLVVTAHSGGDLPPLAVCETTPALLAAIVRRLPAGDALDGGLIDDTDVASAFEQSSGDIREALFRLYDLFEERRRGL